ncbi:MAG: acetyl-CoA carboxylase biotin carboxyl carrier protein subunit [Rubrivivax sp.]|nr:acetyl-CoA carboxylase biotin carboxyl carrier protein subunit [Rubrivivax sp.]
MNEDLVRRLSDWLAGTDIAWLELRGPGMQVCLHNDGSRVDAVPDGEWLAPTRAEEVEVRAASVGIFLHSHPLREAPLATPGQPVGAGQPLGLLRIGSLLLPVTAPREGTFVGHAAEHGRTVGYGTPLLHLACSPVT